MLNEMKKITRDIAVKVLFLIIIILSVGISIFSINSASSQESLDSSERINGKDAINLQKTEFLKTKGEITTDKVNEVINYYKKIQGADEAYMKTNFEFPGTFEIVSDAYTKGIFTDSENLRNLENGDDFYNRNAIKIKSILDESNNKYKDFEKQEILKRAEEVSKPFNMDYSEQWTYIFKAFTLVFIVISLSAVFIGSKLFSYEKEKNMDLILVTLGDKKVKNIGKNKVIAMLSFLTIEFIVSVLIISLIIFSSAGFTALTSQVQIKYFTSIMNLNFGTAYLLSIFTGWLCIMAVGVLVATINSFIQRNYKTLVVGFITVFIPIIVSRVNSLPLTFKKFMMLNPINGVMVEQNINSLNIFNFGIKVPLQTGIIIFAVVILIIGILVSPKIFNKNIRD